MKSRRSRRRSNTNQFWQSYSDMMAALLLVFVLILAGTILRLQEEYNAMNEEASEAIYRASIAESEAQDLKGNLDEKNAELERIVGIRQSLIKALREKFSGEELSVDPQTGSIVFKADLMFDFRDTTLNETYKDTLRIFIKKYVEVLMCDEFAPHVAEIIIEGHTDSVGSYEDNLWFSQQRALSVAAFILSEHEKVFNSEELKYLRTIVTINGRSESDLILHNGVEDPNASRRVEIQFRLKDEEMIQKMVDAIS